MGIRTQAHGEDLLLWYRYNYYVLEKSVISDVAYDAFEKELKSKWCASMVNDIASDMAADYPLYIREMRRPDAMERAERDRLIGERWMRELV